MTLSPIDPSRSDRHLLAGVLRWARRNGWRRGELGWVNAGGDKATINVHWSSTEIGFARAVGVLTVGPCWSCSTWVRVTSVIQALDVLVAVGILPPLWSSSYALAVERYSEQIETLEADLNRKDHYLSLADDTIAGLIEENRELRRAAFVAQLSAVGGEVA